MKKFKCRRPRFKRGNKFVAVVDMDKYSVKAGDEFKPLRTDSRGANRTAHAVIQHLYNRKKVGYADTAWTKQAIEAYKNGHKILPYSVHETHEEALAAKVKFQVIRDEVDSKPKDWAEVLLEETEPTPSIEWLKADLLKHAKSMKLEADDSMTKIQILALIEGGPEDESN